MNRSLILAYVTACLAGFSLQVPEAQEISLTPAMVRATTAAIQRAGYSCPLVKLAWAKGQDAFGAVTKVWCGPTEREGIYERAVFRFTIRPDNTVLIEPWQD